MICSPRARFERATYCLGGMIRAWLDEAGHSLMRYLPAATIAGRGWVSPDVCRRWLPFRLPVISLAPLTLMPHLPTRSLAGGGHRQARPASGPHAHMATPAPAAIAAGQSSAAASVSQAGEGLSLRFPPRRIDARSCHDGSGRATDARMRSSLAGCAGQQGSRAVPGSPCGQRRFGQRAGYSVRGVNVEVVPAEGMDQVGLHLSPAKRSCARPPRVSLPRRDPRNSGRQSARDVSGSPRARQQDQLAAQKCPAPAARASPRPEPVPLHRDGLVDLDGPAAG